MKAIAPAHLSRQYGMSLIGLLIGLLISVLCILASLTLYKNLIHVATESKLDSNHDGQIASAMLVMQLEVLSAGYGIEEANFDHIIRHTPESGEIQLLWRFSPDSGTTFECRGFHEEQLDDDGIFRVLKLIKATSGCNGTATLSSLSWEDVSELGRWRVVDDGVTGVGLDDHILTKSTMFDFKLEEKLCSPYGASSGATENHGFLTVTVPGSAALQNAPGITASEYQFCLPNIYLASP
jgi:Tfp pilus assembly protein PilW